MTLYQGDNTQAFGGRFIRINVVFKDKGGNILPTPEMTKAEFRSGCVKKTVDNPTFPLDLNFDEAETKMLNSQNEGYLAVWDKYGRKKTPDGKIVFTTLPQRV